MRIDWNGKRHEIKYHGNETGDGFLIGSDRPYEVRLNGKTVWHAPGTVAVCIYCRTCRDDSETLAFRGPLLIGGTVIPGAIDFYCGCLGWE